MQLEPSREGSVSGHVDDAPWENLLKWLTVNHGMKIPEGGLHVRRRPTAGAGFGLYAARPCPPSTTLFAIPGTALMNARTLSPHYPNASTLSATCLIALHLLLNRPRGTAPSSDPLFGPYISVLPVNFDSHPLMWLVRCTHGTQGSAVFEEKLLQVLPPSYTDALSALRDRFWTDWKAVSEYICLNPEALGNASSNSRDTIAFQHPEFSLILDFVWAWLIVNTRCIFHHLKSSRSHPDNLTLCPIMDFANHTADILSSIRPASDARDLWQTPKRSPKADAFALVSPPALDIPADQELFLNYGAHSNRVLFIEYGFVNMTTPHGILMGTDSGEVDLGNLLVEKFTSLGSCGGEAKAILEEAGYWGDWTLHSCPPPAYPSYRVMVTLRLLSIFSSPAPRDTAIPAWWETVRGIREGISEDNDKSWRRELGLCCKAIMDRAEIYLKRTEKSRCMTAKAPSWETWMFENISQIWKEELYVAKAVENSLENDEQF